MRFLVVGSTKMEQFRYWASMAEELGKKRRFTNRIYSTIG